MNKLYGIRSPNNIWNIGKGERDPVEKSMWSKPKDTWNEILI